MSKLVEAIKTVAAFADVGEEALNQWYSEVHFRKGEVFAANGVGGASEAIDPKLKLNCGVKAGRLLKALKAVKGDVALTTENNKLVIASKGCTARLDATNDKDGPAFYRPAKDSDWKPTPLLSQVKRVAWCCAAEDRRHLSGVHLDGNGISATNGSALVRIKGTDFLEILGQTVLVPPVMLEKLPDLCWIHKKENKLFISTIEDHSCFRVSSLIDAQFPQLDQVIESVLGIPSAVVNRGQLLDVVKRAAISHTHLTLEVSGNRLSVKISEGSSLALFDFMDSVTLEENEGIQKGIIGVDSRWLKPMLEYAGADTIKIRLRPEKGGGLDPIMIEAGGDFLGVLMPLRL